MRPAKKVIESKDRTPGLNLARAFIPFLKSQEETQDFILAKGMTPTRILSVDPGTTNIAVCFIDLESGQIITSKIDPPNLQTIDMNVLYREFVLENWVIEYKPEVIIREGVGHGYKFGVAEAGRLQYIISRVGFLHGVPVVTVANTTMRKFVGASGGDNTKSDVKLRVFQRWAQEFASEDECDAFAIAQTGIALLAGKIDVKGKKK